MADFGFAAKRANDAGDYVRSLNIVWDIWDSFGWATAHWEVSDWLWDGLLCFQRSADYSKQAAVEVATKAALRARADFSV